MTDMLEIVAFPWNLLLLLLAALAIGAAAVAIRDRRRAQDLGRRKEILDSTTPGAQRQIDEIRAQVAHALRAGIIALVLIGIGFGLNGWQIDNAFDSVEQERLSRIGGQSSINAYFCRKIDEVGNGVGGLVGITLPDERPPNLTEREEEAFDRFKAYVDKQRQPPRCRQVALQLALLTGADPEDVVITPLRLRPRDEEAVRGGRETSRP